MAHDLRIIASPSRIFFNKPAAFLELPAAAARARLRVRLRFLPLLRLVVFLAWLVTEDLIDSLQSFGCLGVSLSRCQCVVPPGLVMILGDAFTLLVTFLRREEGGHCDACSFVGLWSFVLCEMVRLTARLYCVMASPSIATLCLYSSTARSRFGGTPVPL